MLETRSEAKKSKNHSIMFLDFQLQGKKLMCGWSLVVEIFCSEARFNFKNRNRYELTDMSYVQI